MTASITRVARHVLRVAAALERRGCQVLAAHAISGRGSVRIAPPPAGLIHTWGYLEPKLREPMRCCSSISGVRVEWEARR